MCPGKNCSIVSPCDSGESKGLKSQLSAEKDWDTTSNGLPSLILQPLVVTDIFSRLSSCNEGSIRGWFPNIGIVSGAEETMVRCHSTRAQEGQKRDTRASPPLKTWKGLDVATSFARLPYSISLFVLTVFLLLTESLSVSINKRGA